MTDSKRQKPRALLIADVAGPGGVTTHMGRLVQIAEAFGWRVSVLMDNRIGSEPMARFFHRQNVDLMMGDLYRGLHSQETITRTVKFALARFKPDLVHVHCGSPRSAITPREIAAKNALPLIFTEHFVSAGMEIQEDLLSRIRDLYTQAFLVISVCDENRRLLRERFEFYAENHVVIRNGVDLQTHRKVENRKSQRIEAVIVARLSPEKGIDVLVRAVAMLPVNKSQLFHFTVLGDGELQFPLRRLVETLGVKDRITFAGWCDDVHSRLPGHDLFVLPSLAEGQPIALLEALSHSLPCIASAVSGIPEALGYGKYGALVPPNDPASLAEAISSFVDEPDVLQRKAIEAREYLESHHDPQRNFGEILRHWGNAIGYQQNQSIL